MDHRAITLHSGPFGPGIYGFFGDYRWLSNFHISFIYLDEKLWPSVEHYYQAQKDLDPTVREFIRCAESPKMAKRLGGPIEKGGIVKLRPDWEDVKDQIMLRALSRKYHYNDWCGEMLVRTNTLYLEETNWWDDQYWGVCKGKGLNKLGQFTMMVRKEIIDLRARNEYKY